MIDIIKNQQHKMNLFCIKCSNLRKIHKDSYKLQRLKDTGDSKPIYLNELDNISF